MPAEESSSAQIVFLSGPFHGLQCFARLSAPLEAEAEALWPSVREVGRSCFSLPPLITPPLIFLFLLLPDQLRSVPAAAPTFETAVSLSGIESSLSP